MLYEGTKNYGAAHVGLAGAGRWGIYFTSGLLLGSYFRLQGVSRVLAGARFLEVGHHDPRAQPSPYFCLGGHLFCPAAVASFPFQEGEN